MGAVKAVSWMSTPEGKKAMKQGAVVVYKGAVIAGKAVTKAAKYAVNGIIQGTQWVGGKISDGANWVGGIATNAWGKVTGLFSNKDSKHGNAPLTGKPNSSQDIKNKNGKVTGRRHYGPDGKADKDEHYTDHGNPSQHKNPHDHEWDWSDPKHPRYKK